MKDIKCKINLRSLLEYEHVTGRSFFSLTEGNSDVLMFAYCVFRTSNPDQYLSYEGFLSLMANKSFTNTFFNLFEQETKNLSFGDKNEKEEKGETSDESSITIQRLVDVLIVDVGLDAQWVLYDMPLWMLLSLFDTYAEKKLEEMQNNRLSHYFQVLPLLAFGGRKGSKIEGPEDLYSLPGEKSKRQKKEEELKKMSASLRNLFKTDKKKASDNKEKQTESNGDE